MPLIYVGKYTLFQGRPLWEIVMNLKNFGVGRLVGRNLYRRYPEVTYFKVLQVNPLQLEYPEKQGMKGLLLMEKTFRGVTQPEPWNAGLIAYKPDWFLIPKAEEEAFKKSGSQPVQRTTVYPKYMKYPPLWQELIKRDKASMGLEAKEEDLRCPLLYRGLKGARVAEDGETPDFNIEEFRPRRTELYPFLNQKSEISGR